jgi:hypothetical protein
MGRMKDIFMEIREKFEDEIPSDFDINLYLNHRANGVESELAFSKLGFPNQDLENTKQKENHQN